jgi:hypothetical protein
MNLIPCLSPLRKVHGVNCILFSCLLRCSRQNFTILDDVLLSWWQKKVKKSDRICQLLSALYAKATKPFSRDDKRVATELATPQI